MSIRERKRKERREEGRKEGKKERKKERKIIDSATSHVSVIHFTHLLPTLARNFLVWILNG